MFESVLERIRSCNWYTSLDIAAGNVQIRLSPDAQNKCGLITESEVYEFLRLPFGLKDAASVFSCIMAK